MFRGDGDGGIHKDVFDFLHHGRCQSITQECLGAGTHAHYRLKEQAEADIAQACVAFGRFVVGLPKLKQSEVLCSTLKP